MFSLVVIFYKSYRLNSALNGIGIKVEKEKIRFKEMQSNVTKDAIAYRPLTVDPAT